MEGDNVAGRGGDVPRHVASKHMLCVCWGFWFGGVCGVLGWDRALGSLRQFRLIACQLSALCVGGHVRSVPWSRRFSNMTRWPL